MNPLADPQSFWATVRHYNEHFAQTWAPAYQRCKQYAKGAYLASPSYDSSRAVGTHSDPTAQRVHLISRDETVQHARKFAELEKRLLATYDEMDRMVGLYPPVRQGTADEGDVTRCASCARIGRDEKAEVMAPRRPEIPNLPLCRTCNEYSKEMKQWPTRADLEYQARTGRLPRYRTTEKAGT